MLLDLKFSIGTLGIGSGALLAGFFGMNLKNFVEESNLGFMGVTGSTLVLAAIVCVFGLHKLRRVQRVSMWGERGRVDGRGSWNQVEPGAVGQGTTAIRAWKGRELGAGADGCRNPNSVPQPDLPLQMIATIPTVVSAAVAKGKLKQKRPSWRKHGLESD